MPNHEALLEDIIDVIIDGDEDLAPEIVQQALQEGLSPLTILDEGLMVGADEVGQLFESGECFLPELMLAGRALKAAMDVITPVLQVDTADADQIVKDTGTVVIATIQTDIHDIGKNMVASMLTASGFQVLDLGVDVPLKTIIARAKEENADIIGCSGLLTTSMPYIRDLLDLLKAMNERQHFKVMVGGAPVTEAWAKEIGADGTAPNPVEAVHLAKQLIREQRMELIV